MTADLTLAAHEVTRNGQKHLAVDKLSLSFDTTKLHMRFDNLFNGNKELGKSSQSADWSVVPWADQPGDPEEGGTNFTASQNVQDYYPSS